MNAPSTIPIIATTTVYADFISAARRNLECALRCSQGWKEADCERELQALLDGFNDLAADALPVVAPAHEPVEDVFGGTMVSDGMFLATMLAEGRVF